MPEWELPYESSGKTAYRYVSASLSSLFAVGESVSAVVGAHGALAAWPAVPFLLTVFGLGPWRIVLVGVWVSDEGVRVNMVHRTRRVPWPDVDRVWLAPATRYDALALWISTRDGTDIETPIWRAGTHVQHRNRTKLKQPELSAFMERLRAGARQAAG